MESKKPTTKQRDKLKSLYLAGSYAVRYKNVLVYPNGVISYSK